MKNLKKVLALVLAFACAFTMFAGAAFTDSADIKVKSEVVDTLVELGVIQGYDDGSFRPNETVTRAQMAKMIYVLRTGNSDASAYNDDYTTFTDISTHWGRGYIKYCQSLGIIAGKSATVFAPDVKVTTQEAAKMLLVTLGYDAKKAGLVGTGWASKTNALADENGLLDDVNTSFSGPCPRQYAAQLIYNTIDAPTVVWRDDAYHHTNVLDKDNQTVGEKYMGLKKTVATLTNVTKTSGKDTYELTLDNRNDADSTDGAYAIMSFTNVAKDYSALKYKTVTVLHKDRKTVFGVYATDDNTEKTGLLKNLKMDSAKKVKLNGTKYDLATDAQGNEKTSVYVNGSKISDNISTFVNTYGDGATLKYKNAAYFQGTSVSLLATDGTSNYSILNVKTYAVGKVTNVGSDYVNVSWKAGDKSFTETKCNDDDWDWYDGIKKDDYVIMTAAGNYASGHGLIEKADVVSGKVTAVKSTDAVSVGGNWYTMAGRDNSNDSTVANQYNSMVVRPNTNSTVDMVVVNGYVYYTDTTKGSIEDVALLVEAAAKGGTGSKWEARLIFSDGSDKTVDIEKNWEDKDNKTNPITAMNESDSPILVTYTVSKDVYTLTQIGANHTYDGDTDYETAGYDAYVAITGANIVTDGSVKGGTFAVKTDKGQTVSNVARMYYEATGSVFVKYDGTPVDAQGHALVANPNGTGYVLASDRTTTAVLKGFDDASYKVITGKAASNYDKKTLTEVKAVADKSGNSYYAQAAYINLGALKSGGNSDKNYAVATSDSGKDTSNGTVYTVTGWNGTEELTFKAEDSFGTLKAGDVFEYSALGNDLYDIDKVNAGEYYVNSYDEGTGDIELYDVVSGKPGTLQADTATLNKTKVDSKDTTVIFVNSDDGKGAAATEIKSAYIFDADSWSNGKLPTLNKMQLTNGKVVDQDDATNFLTEDNAPNVKAYFDDDDQITLLVVDINNNITQW